MKKFFTIIILFVSNLITAQNFANEITIIQNETSKTISKENDHIHLKRQPLNVPRNKKILSPIKGLLLDVSEELDILKKAISIYS